MKLLHRLLTSTYLKNRATQRQQMPQGMQSHSAYDSADSHLPTGKTNTKNNRHYLHMAAAMLMSVCSTGAMAAESCENGYTPVTLSPSDYQKLQQGLGGSIDIEGNNQIVASLGLQLNIDMTNYGSTPYIASLFSNNQTGFTIVQNLNNQNQSNKVTFSFNKPITKMNFTLYDIDYRYSQWRDKITITGKNGNNPNPVPLKFTNPGLTIASADNTTRVVESVSTYGSECQQRPGQYSWTPKEDYSPKCATTVKFDAPIKQFELDYANTIGSSPRGQNIELQFNNFCVEDAKLKIEKDDGITEVNTGSITNYIIKVKNSSSNVITGAKLSDPAVSGLIKQSGIQCDSSTPSNACNSQPLPTIDDLETASGYSLPNLAAGQTYAIIVPTKVTASSGGDITNTATVTYNSKTVADTDTNTVTSPFTPPPSEPTEPGSCPTGHQMYYVGANPPSNSIHEALAWTDGDLQRTFTFSDGKQLTIKFPFLTETKNEVNKVPPYYGDFGDAFGIPKRSKDAINVFHKSEGKKHNHTIEMFVSPSIAISQAGFVIQDIDSERQDGTDARYIERVDVSGSEGGQLTYEPAFHNINTEKNIVTAKKAYGQNIYDCSLGECSVHATWQSVPTGTSFPANKTFILKHWNMSTITSGTGHNAGYSDFYFCLAPPPKITLKKQLTGQRVYSDDEFKIEIKGNQNSDNPAGSFTTEGSGSQFDDNKNTSALIELKANKTYNVTETIINNNPAEQPFSDMTNYDASYSCINTAKSTNNVIAEGNGSSFTLPNLNYADNIICTITNTPRYTFSGIVFNDNGGMNDGNADPTKTNGVYTNSAYFNGLYETNEQGIYAEGLSVKLTDCNGTAINNQNVFIAHENGSMISTNDASNTIVNAQIKKGQYKISAPYASLKNRTNVCVEQIEPSAWSSSNTDTNSGDNIYPIDTTPNRINVTLQADQLNYADNNFGEVIQKNAALVLLKRQQINSCNNYAFPLTGEDSNDATTGFSKNSAELSTDQCVAYRITAKNRGHVKLFDISISDDLNVNMLYVNTPPATSYPDGITIHTSANSITTSGFELVSGAVQHIFFNTKPKNADSASGGTSGKAGNTTATN